MADTFEITSALPTQRIGANQQLESIIEATAVTKPHNVSFTVSVLKAPGWRDELIAKVRAEAEELESIFGA